MSPLANLSQEEYDKLENVMPKEVKELREYPGWVNAWWTPDYRVNRMLALLKDINSKNKDIEYIRSKKQYNQSLQMTPKAGAFELNRYIF